MALKQQCLERILLKIIWQAEDGKDLIHKIQIKLLDVLLMYIRMPEMDGINSISILRKEYEAIKIIVFTMYYDQEMISKMMEIGANAQLTKTTEPKDLFNAILTFMNDDYYFNELLNKAVFIKIVKKNMAILL